MAHRSYARWFVFGALITTQAVVAPGCGSDNGGADARADSGQADTSVTDTGNNGFDATTGEDATTGNDATTDGGASDASPDASDAVVGDAARNLGCIGMPLPTTAAATVNASGRTQTVSGMGIGGVSVQVVSRAGSVLGMDTTASTGSVGSFNVSAPTGSTPLDAYLNFAATGYVPTRLYPPSPLAMSVANLDIRMLTTLLVNFGIYGAPSGVARQAGTGTIIALVRDCGRQPLAGATLTFAPTASVRYSTGAVGPSATATATPADGIAYGLNAPVGNVVVTASYGGQMLRSVTVASVADGVTQVIVDP